MILDYVSLPVFFVSFIIGLIFIFIIGPETKTIYMYPTPDSYMKNMYKDNADQCFQFIPKSVSCPLNPLEIHTVPIQ